MSPARASSMSGLFRLTRALGRGVPRLAATNGGACGGDRLMTPLLGREPPLPALLLGVRLRLLLPHRAFPVEWPVLVPSVPVGVNLDRHTSTWRRRPGDTVPKTDTLSRALTGPLRCPPLAEEPGRNAVSNPRPRALDVPSRGRVNRQTPALCRCEPRRRNRRQLPDGRRDPTPHPPDAAQRGQSVEQRVRLTRRQTASAHRLTGYRPPPTALTTGRRGAPDPAPRCYGARRSPARHDNTRHRGIHGSIGRPDAPRRPATSGRIPKSPSQPVTRTAAQTLTGTRRLTALSRPQRAGPIRWLRRHHLPRAPTGLTGPRRRTRPAGVRRLTSRPRGSTPAANSAPARRPISGAGSDVRFRLRSARRAATPLSTERSGSAERSREVSRTRARCRACGRRGR